MNTSLGLTSLVIASLLSAPASAQIQQDHPEYCGTQRDSFVPLPEGTSFYAPDSGGHLTIKQTDGTLKVIGLPLPDAVRQVCPINGSRLLVFGSVAGGDGPHVWIVSQIDGAILDHIGSRAPATSPNQRWIIYRKFYAPRSKIHTDSYDLYDLSKDAAANRLPAGGVEGLQVYPVTKDHVPFGLDDELEPLHSFAGDSFFWSPDSKFVVFEDGSEGRTSIILVEMNEGNPTTFVHPLQARDVCDTKYPGEVRAATLTRAEFEPMPGTLPDLLIHFRAYSCDKPARLTAADFKPAEIEVHQKIKFAK